MTIKKVCKDCDQTMKEGMLYAKKFNDLVCENCYPKMRNGCTACDDKKSLLNWSYGSDFLCDKCDQIEISGGCVVYFDPLLEKEMLDIAGERRFIWYDARKEMGLQFYIEARDKLIKKLDEINKCAKKRVEQKKKRMLKRIESW